MFGSKLSKAPPVFQTTEPRKLDWKNDLLGQLSEDKKSSEEEGFFIRWIGKLKRLTK